MLGTHSLVRQHLASPSARRHSYTPGPITRAHLLRLLHRSSPNTASSLPLPPSSFPSPSSSLRPSSTSALNRRRAATCLRPQCEAAGERSPSGPAQSRRRRRTGTWRRAVGRSVRCCGDVGAARCCCRCRLHPRRAGCHLWYDSSAAATPCRRKVWLLHSM